MRKEVEESDDDELNQLLTDLEKKDIHDNDCDSVSVSDNGNCDDDAKDQEGDCAYNNGGNAFDASGNGAIDEDGDGDNGVDCIEVV